MNMKRFAAALLCVLMLASFAACKSNPTYNELPTPPENTIQLEDATGSVLLGDWTVEAVASRITEISFHQDGSVVMVNNRNNLGGSFTDDGTTVAITISGQTLKGTYAVEGDKITITTDNDKLVLTKK